MLISHTIPYIIVGEGNYGAKKCGGTSVAPLFAFDEVTKETWRCEREGGSYESVLREVSIVQGYSQFALDVQTSRDSCHGKHDKN